MTREERPMGNSKWKKYLQGCALLIVLAVPALAQTASDQAVNQAMQEGVAQMKAGNFAQAAAAPTPR